MQGHVVPVSARAQQPNRGGRRGHRQKAAWLPLDVIAEIAARSDAATLVRCAATCRDARRRIAEVDPGRLRLRGTERFVLPLLRGHLTGLITTYKAGHHRTDVHMVDTTGAADATRLVKATANFAEPDDATTLTNVSMDSRGGLVLVRATANTTTTTTQRQLLVCCNLATGRCQALPPEPAFPDDDGRTGAQSSVLQLLVGDREGEGGAAVGRPFRVLKAKLVLSLHRKYRRLLVHTFSSEHGAWSPLTAIPTPNLHGTGGKRWGRPLVVGDVVHWLCLTGSGSFMLVLHVATARVNVTSLPTSFPRGEGHQYLLATATVGGNPVVLVADADRISAWEQSKHTRIWKPQPQVVIENKTILGFKDDGLPELVEWEKRTKGEKHVPHLLWFGERSGVVLLRIQSYLFWLDLHSKKIVRCFSLDGQMQCAQVYCPYEVDLSSWVPTFSNTVAL